MKMSEETKLKISLSKKGCKSWNKGLPTEKQPWFGKKLSKEHKEKLSKVKQGKKKIINCLTCNLEFNIPKSQENKRKFCSYECYWKDKTGKESHLKGVKMPNRSGENHFAWIKDRTKLAKRQERNDMAYKEWRKNVWLRDNFTCKIANPNCKGHIEAHHILSWRDFPELRYEINNGITLCHAHHPRKRSEEAKLSSYFQKLVAKMN